MSIVNLFGLFSFAVGCTEFLSIGMMDSIANEMGVARSSAGLLVVLYALGVVIGGPILTVFTTLMDKKKVIFFTMLSFAIFNSFISLTNSFFGILVLRFIVGAIHGLFFGMATAIIRQTSEKKYVGRNIAMIFTVFFATMAIGVPAGSFLTKYISFHLVFFFTSVIALVTAFLFLRFAPKLINNKSKITMSSIKDIFKEKRILLVYLVSITIFTSSFMTQVYLGSFLKKVSSFPDADLPLAFFITGCGAFFGSRLSGIISDKRGILPTIGAGLLFYFIIIWCAILFGQHPVAVLLIMFLWNFFVFLTAPAITGSVLRIAQIDLPGSMFIIASINVSMINAGIMLGSLFGGFFVSGGLLTYLPYGSLVLLCFSITFFLLRLRIDRSKIIR